MAEKINFADMKERINWIDWAKAIAVTTVVFCHLPQSQEWFYYRYLQSVIIVIFFFLSGYLKKDRGSDKANWQKYWHGLVIPYFLYNAIVYPYWFVKFYMTHEGWPTLFEAMRPIVGALLFQHENSFAEPLNGPLWYLPAILFMHVTVDLCRKTRYQHHILITLCIISFFLYAANKYWYFAPNLTPMGLMRNLPYYYIGYLMGRKQYLKAIRPKRDAIKSLVCMGCSFLLFYWHLQAFYGGRHLLHIILFYPVNIGFLFGALYGCKLIDSYKSTIVTNLSIGTLVIIGIHIVFITILNYIFGHIQTIHFPGYYEWYQAILVSTVITVCIYPIIIWSMTNCPYFLGRNR